MAKVANNFRIGFSYLHIISDGVFMKFSEDLSNERRLSIFEKRNKLLNTVKSMIDEIVRTW